MTNESAVRRINQKIWHYCHMIGPRKGHIQRACKKLAKDRKQLDRKSLDSQQEAKMVKCQWSPTRSTRSWQPLATQRRTYICGIDALDTGVWIECHSEDHAKGTDIWSNTTTIQTVNERCASKPGGRELLDSRCVQNTGRAKELCSGNEQSR